MDETKCILSGKKNNFFFYTLPKQSLRNKFIFYMPHSKYSYI